MKELTQRDIRIRIWIQSQYDTATPEEACEILAKTFICDHLGFPEIPFEKSFWLYRRDFNMFAAFQDFSKMGIADCFYCDRVVLDPEDFIRDVLKEDVKRFKKDEDLMNDYIAYCIFEAIDNECRSIAEGGKKNA